MTEMACKHVGIMRKHLYFTYSYCAYSNMLHKSCQSTSTWGLLGKKCFLEDF